MFCILSFIVFIRGWFLMADSCKGCKCLECEVRGSDGRVSCDRCDLCVNEDLKLSERSCFDD